MTLQLLKAGAAQFYRKCTIKSRSTTRKSFELSLKSGNMQNTQSSLAILRSAIIIYLSFLSLTTGKISVSLLKGITAVYIARGRMVKGCRLPSTASGCNKQPLIKVPSFHHIHFWRRFVIDHTTWDVFVLFWKAPSACAICSQEFQTTAGQRCCFIKWNILEMSVCNGQPPLVLSVLTDPAHR